MRRDGWRVRLRRDLRSPRRPTRHAPGDASAAELPEDAVTGLARSPAVGYFSPAPVLRVGHTVQAGDRWATSTCWASRSDVSAPSGGLISAVLAEAGQAVEYGQVLAEIEALPEPSGDVADHLEDTVSADVFQGSPVAGPDAPPGTANAAAQR